MRDGGRQRESRTDGQEEEDRMDRERERQTKREGWGWKGLKKEAEGKDQRGRV